MVPHVLQIGSHVMLPKHPSTFKANCTLNLVKLSFIWRIVFWLDIYISTIIHIFTMVSISSNYFRLVVCTINFLVQ